MEAPTFTFPRSHAAAWERSLDAPRRSDNPPRAPPSDAERREAMFPRGSVGTRRSSTRATCLTEFREGAEWRGDVHVQPAYCGCSMPARAPRTGS